MLLNFFRIKYGPHYNYKDEFKILKNKIPKSSSIQTNHIRFIPGMQSGLALET